MKTALLYRYTATLITVALLLVSCGGGERPMKLLSSAFSHQGSISIKYAAAGEDLSPPLKWQGVPEGTRSLALICEDPDAPGGTYDHWLLYDIPPSMDSLPEGLKQLPSGIKGGLNSAGTKGYVGPNPPSGTHRYFFVLYALDTVLDLPDGTTKVDLLNAMRGHVLADATLMGQYQRR